MTSRTLAELTGELAGVPSRVEEESKQGLDAGPGGSGLHSWPSASTAMSLGNEMGGDGGSPAYRRIGALVPLRQCIGYPGNSLT
jgi:hypothetical protein